MNLSEMEKEILARIAPLVFAPDVLDVRDFGAVPDADGDQTSAFQAAIDEAHARGGGQVRVPSGTYGTAALRLKGGVDLHLAAPDTVLRFSTETDEAHYPLVYGHWEGTPCYNYSALLYAYEAENIAVTGPGTLDGQAGPSVWWNWHHQMEEAWSARGVNLQEEASKRLRRMNLDGVPVRDRVFGDGSYLRPQFVQFIRCKNVLLEGFTILRSPMWQLNPVMCENVTVRGVTLSSHGPNSDGCDPESCDGVLIEGCRFDTGDDCISLKSGRDRDGRAANQPCQNIVIRENDFADGHGGIALGSEMSGGIRNVVARRNRFASPNLTYALRLKSNAKRGGIVENILLADSDIQTVRAAAIHGTMMYEDGRAGEYLPTFRNITIENVRSHGGLYGIFLEAFPEVPITGLILRHIQMDGVSRCLHAANWLDAVVEDVTINGLAFPRPTAAYIVGVPRPGAQVSVGSRGCAGTEDYTYQWQLGEDTLASGQTIVLPAGCVGQTLCVTATDSNGRQCTSIPYRVLSETNAESQTQLRLRTRGMLQGITPDLAAPITRLGIARMLLPLADDRRYEGPIADVPPNDPDGLAVRAALGNEMLTLRPRARFDPDGTITREEMATVAMQACGVSYQNASYTMPDCTDVAEVNPAHGTDTARAQYFGFMMLDAEKRFHPKRPATWAEAIATLNAVADFAGL